MKKLLSILFLFFAYFSFGQGATINASGKLVSGSADSAVTIGSQVQLQADTSGKIGMAKLNGTFYFWDGYWKQVSGGSNNLYDTSFLGSKIRGLSYFQTKLRDSINYRKINVRLIGTSISLGNSYANYFLKSIENTYGSSNNQFFLFANQAEQVVYGWKTQYYGGVYSIRVKGRSDSAITYPIEAKGKQLIIYYSKDTDGGTIGVKVRYSNGDSLITSINCYAVTKSYNNSFVINLNEYQNNNIELTPPTSGYGYLEYYVVNSVQQGGIFQCNSSYGGSALGNAAGNIARIPKSGMYPTDVPIGDNGLKALFAPTDSVIKPDLIIYSGFTNDYGFGASLFRTNLTKSVQLAVANKSSIILCIEPLNGASFKSNWADFRKVYYDLQDSFPANVSVYDWEAFLTPSLNFNPQYHSPNLSDPHPGDYGYGNPHILGGADFIKKFGLYNQNQYSNYYKDATFSTNIISGKEPLYVPIGSWWTDTSISLYLNKKLITRTKLGSKGIWETASKLNTPIYNTLPDAYYGVYANDTSIINTTCVRITATTGFGINRNKFVAGKTYTLSFNAQIDSVNGLMSYGLYFGNNPFYLLTNNFSNKFSFSTSNLTNTIYPELGTLQKIILTFTMPSDAEMVSAGISLSGNGGLMTLRISQTKSVKIFDFKVEEGASYTTFKEPYTYQFATNANLTSIVSSIEPTNLEIGNTFIDTINSSYKVKTLHEKNTVTNVVGASMNTLGVWKKNVPQPNILKGLLSSATATTSNGGSVSIGTNGLNNAVSVDFVSKTGNANNTVDIDFPLNSVSLDTNKYYSLSFLVKGSYANSVTTSNANVQFFLQLKYSSDASLTYWLDANQILQANSFGSGIIFFSFPKDGNWHRCVLKFKSQPNLLIPNTNLLLRVIGFNETLNGGQKWTLSDLKLEEGASVTTDDGSGGIVANYFKKQGGMPSQLLAADGSVLTAGSGVSITGGTISATIPLLSINNLGAVTSASIDASYDMYTVENTAPTSVSVSTSGATSGKRLILKNKAGSSHALTITGTDNNDSIPVGHASEYVYDGTTWLTVSHF